MKKLHLLVWLVCASFPAAAQITVPASTFPFLGDILRYKTAANPGIAVALYTPPGGNQFWDLSALTEAAALETSYFDPLTGTYQASFPAATLLVKGATTEDYYKVSDTKVEHLGQAALTVGGLPLLALYINQPPAVERYAPLNFFDIYQYSSGNLIVWKYNDIPAGAFYLPPGVIPDSVRMRIAVNALSTVDAYGTLRLPGALPQSDFPVLRLKKTTYREQRVDAKIPPLGWLDVTDQVIQNGGAWAPLMGVDTVVEHHYYNDVSKEVIAVLRFNAAQNAVINVTYKNTQPVSPVVDIPGEASVRLEVYPNPATSVIMIRCAGAPSGMYTLAIFNSLGALVGESTYLLTENTPIQATLPPGLNGLYFCRLEDANGKVVGTGQIVVTP